MSQVCDKERGHRGATRGEPRLRDSCNLHLKGGGMDKDKGDGNLRKGEKAGWGGEVDALYNLHLKDEPGEWEKERLIWAPYIR